MSQPDPDFARLADPYRRELLVHCYRMLGSYHDAEDVVQETYLRAWRGFASFRGQASVRTWLYKIATNACLNLLDSAGRRRLLPSGLGGPADDLDAPLDRRPELPWLEPLPDFDHDPADVALRHESTRLAFVAALQQLPARQRAVLVLRDVLEWPAAEVAPLLDMTVAGVNSALQRARAQLAGARPAEEEMTMSTDARVVDDYVNAFLAADMRALTALLRQDVELEMPPVPTWFRGRDAVAAFFDAHVMNAVVRRFVPIRANGCTGAAVYNLDARGVFRANSVQVLETRDGGIEHIYVFLEPRLFAAFGLPDVWT